MFEYGAGGSTLWLAARVATVVSVEHSPVWHGRVCTVLVSRQNATCQVLLRPPRKPNITRVVRVPDGHPDTYAAYIGAIDEFPDGFFDLVLVDGRSRVACLERAAPKVRTGGMLLLDDADRPAYAPGIAELPSWPRSDFRGLRPCWGSEPSLTAIWTRPR